MTIGFFVGLYVMVVALTVPGIAGAARRPVFCGHVQRTVAVSAHQIACPTARRVADGYLAGRKRIDGFDCRRYPIDAAAGWYAKCTRRQAVIEISPE